MIDVTTWQASAMAFPAANAKQLIEESQLKASYPKQVYPTSSPTPEEGAGAPTALFHTGVQAHMGGNYNYEVVPLISRGRITG